MTGTFRCQLQAVVAGEHRKVLDKGFIGHSSNYQQEAWYLA